MGGVTQNPKDMYYRIFFLLKKPLLIAKIGDLVLLFLPIPFVFFLTSCPPHFFSFPTSCQFAQLPPTPSEGLFQRTDIPAEPWWDTAALFTGSWGPAAWAPPFVFQQQNLSQEPPPSAHSQPGRREPHYRSALQPPANPYRKRISSHCLDTHREMSQTFRFTPVPDIDK